MHGVQSLNGQCVLCESEWEKEAGAAAQPQLSYQSLLTAIQ